MFQFNEHFQISLKSLLQKINMSSEFPPNFPGNWETEPFTYSEGLRGLKSLSRNFFFADVFEQNYYGSMIVEPAETNAIAVRLWIWSSDYDDLEPDELYSYEPEVEDLVQEFGDWSQAWEVWTGINPGEDESLVWPGPDSRRGLYLRTSNLAKQVLSSFEEGLGIL